MEGISKEGGGFLDYVTRSVITKYSVRRSEGYLQKKETHQALEVIEEVLEFNPRSRFLHATAAGIYLAVGELLKAQEEYEKALEVPPEHVEVSVDTVAIHSNLSFIYGRMGRQEDALRMMEQTGCDGVMIGRASMKNPWIYRQTWSLLNGEYPAEPTLVDRRDLILEHFTMIREQEEPRLVMHKLRTFTGWYTRGLPEGRELRVRIGSLESPDQFIDAVHEFFRGRAA